MITIFTPTYNRDYTLTKLYNSLLTQTINDFEWVIVDDGSTDNTESLIQQFINDNHITIKYVKQKNGGKHRAINTGLEIAEGELFFIVDSDDYLTSHALERVLFHYAKIQHLPNVAGIIGRRGYDENTVIGTRTSMDTAQCTTLRLRFRHNIRGDIAEVFKTSIFKEFPFPDIPNEKFVAEGLIWTRIAKDYEMLFFNEIIYITEYLEGGLTDRSIPNRKKSPQYATLLYKEFSKSDIPITLKIRAVINYWRFSFYLPISFVEKLKGVSIPFSIVAFPIACLMYVRDLTKR